MEWQPIETAPKDGSYVLTFVPKPWNGLTIKPLRWEEEVTLTWEDVDATTRERRETDSSHWSTYEEPTHWMPLPPPPEIGQ